MNDTDCPWVMPSKIKGESQVQKAIKRDPQFDQALAELSKAKTVEHRKTISPETILRTLATKTKSSELAESRRWLRIRTNQLKREKTNAKKYIDGIKD